MTTSPPAQRSHVALLRGVNVGGHNRVSMGQLREAFAERGFANVATHLQSGNVVFRTTRRARNDILAAQISETLASSLGLQIGVVVKDRDSFCEAAAANPYSRVSELRHVHLVLFAEGLDDALRARVANDSATMRELGHADEVRVLGEALFLWTPDGFARSPLVKALTLGGRAAPMNRGTARNMSSVGAIRSLLGA